MYSTEDTIIALSTPPFPSGIAVIRISGAVAFKVLEILFRPKIKKNPAEIPSRHIVWGDVVDPTDGKIIDEVLAVKFAAPFSYTGEDMCEIHCHGNPYISKRIIESAVALSEKNVKGTVRVAQRGEFTYRAFLNGKIDLVQAEAVLGVIESRSEKSLSSALARLEGRLSKKLDEWKKNLTEIMALVEFSLDMPDEAREEKKSGEEILPRLRALKKSIDEIVEHSDGILEGEIPLAIVGKPNVGKSSLFNALAREDLAIVTPIAGTTRDIISQTLHWDGVTWRVSDTAGISSSSPSDLVEETGRAKAIETAKKTFIAVLVLDGSKPIDSDDKNIVLKLETFIKEKRLVVVFNKSDLPSAVDINEVKRRLGLNEIPTVKTSAARGEGIDELKSALSKNLNLLFYNETKFQPREDQALVGTIRQKHALEKCSRHILDAINDFARGEEIIAHHLKFAADSLKELTGEIANEEILGEIFSKFCVGK